MKDHIQQTSFDTYNIVGQDWVKENKQYFSMVSDLTRKVALFDPSPLPFTLYSIPWTR